MRARLRVFDYGRSKRGTGVVRLQEELGLRAAAAAYEYVLLRGDRIPENNPLNPKYRAFIALWRRLPLPVANLIGPLHRASLGWCPSPHGTDPLSHAPDPVSPEQGRQDALVSRAQASRLEVPRLPRHLRRRRPSTTSRRVRPLCDDTWFGRFTRGLLRSGELAGLLTGEPLSPALLSRRPPANWVDARARPSRVETAVVFSSAMAQYVAARAAARRRRLRRRRIGEVAAVRRGAAWPRLLDLSAAKVQSCSRSSVRRRRDRPRARLSPRQRPRSSRASLPNAPRNRIDRAQRRRHRLLLHRTPGRASPFAGDEEAARFHRCDGLLAEHRRGRLVRPRRASAPCAPDPAPALLHRRHESVRGRAGARAERRGGHRQGAATCARTCSMRRVVVAPLRIARGVQNKVLEAMAMAAPGRRVPSSAAALSARPGVEIEVAETPEGFAAKTLALLASAREIWAARHAAGCSRTTTGARTSSASTKPWAATNRAPAGRIRTHRQRGFIRSPRHSGV